METKYILYVFLISFGIGALPFGVLVSKLFFGFDLREQGSGNIGSTNVFRVLGVKWGIIVQLLDIAKGYVPASLILFQFLRFGADDYMLTYSLLAGLSSVMGHIFSPFIGFKGGKGINTALGMLVAISPIDIGVCLVFFLGIVFSTGIISLGSIFGSLILPLSLVIRHYFISSVDGFHTLKFFFFALPFLIILTHQKNIKRLLNGTENKFSRLQIIKFRKGNV